MHSGFKDTEDGVQYFIAVNNGMDVLITRNIADYNKVDIIVLMPNDFLNLKKIKAVIDRNRGIGEGN
ncbi:MAG: hypothetical protein JW821_03340 [Deltaproteobacteria bacterium]|nr:hypothetical protein [Deltaproteobacteria bacterium]